MSDRGNVRGSITKSANNYYCTLFTKDRDTDIRKNNTIKKERQLEREWQPLITSECSSYYPRSSSSTYIRA